MTTDRQTDRQADRTRGHKKSLVVWCVNVTVKVTWSLNLPSFERVSIVKYEGNDLQFSSFFFHRQTYNPKSRCNKVFQFTFLSMCLEFSFPLSIYIITSDFYGAFAMGVTCQQGTLTLLDTWICPPPPPPPPFWDLLMLQLLRPDFPNLPCLYSTFHLEYLLVLSQFCIMTFKMLNDANCLESNGGLMVCQIQLSRDMYFDTDTSFMVEYETLYRQQFFSKYAISLFFFFW